MLKLIGIYIYPIKSLAGIELQASETEERGLKYDRRWMLVNDQGEFMSQRKYSKMALLKTSISDGILIVTSPDSSSIEMQIDAKNMEIVKVKVWGDECKAYELEKPVNQWFSEQLDANCRLVYMGDEKRYANPKFVRNNEKVRFADGYQYLIVGTSSLDDLNGRLNEPVPMNRFRPNLVFSGGEAFEEDKWGDFSIGNVEFYGIKPCARCVMTTIDQETAMKGKEPLKTLAIFRQRDHKIFFGLNAVSKQLGVIKTGDHLAVKGHE